VCDGLRGRPHGMAKRASSDRRTSDHRAPRSMVAGSRNARETLLRKRAMVLQKGPVELETGGLAARSESERTS